ncbi:MAG: hypothetical protein AAFN30_08235 [Actinomycetota bacterium]
MLPVRRHWGLALASLLLLVAVGAMVVLDQRHGTLRAEVTPTTITWYLVAFAGFGLAAWWNERRSIPAVVFWLVPIGARLLLLATEPTLSDDVYRYLWDGHVLAEGISPYLHPIDAAALDPIEIPIRTQVNNPSLASPYLPTAHGVFVAAAVALPSAAVVMQALMVGFDLLTAVVLRHLLGQAGLPPRRVLLYLWNPLVIVEIAHGAHLDALMVLLTVGALAASLGPAGGHGAGRRSIGSAVLLALAVLTRPLPALVGPVLWPRWGWPARAAFVATTIGLLLPFGLGPAGWGLGTPGTGTGVFGSARIYSRDFQFNGALNTVLEPGSTGASVAAGGAMAGVLLWVWWRAARARPGPAPGAATSASIVRYQLRLAVVPVMAYVLLTPVLHPWYLVMLLALLPFVTPASGERPDRWLLTVPWYYLAAAVSLSYLTYRNPDRFGELVWVQRAEWLPTLALLALVLLRARATRPAADGVEPAGAGGEPGSVADGDVMAGIGAADPGRGQD